MVHLPSNVANLSELERNKLASLFKVKNFSDGKIIITQGEEGSEFFIIKSVSSLLKRMNINYCVGECGGDS